MPSNIESRVSTAILFVIINKGLELLLPAPPPQNILSVSESGYEFLETNRMAASEQVNQQLE